MPRSNRPPLRRPLCPLRPLAALLSPALAQWIVLLLLPGLGPLACTGARLAPGPAPAGPTAQPPAPATVRMPAIQRVARVLPDGRLELDVGRAHGLQPDDRDHDLNPLLRPGQTDQRLVADECVGWGRIEQMDAQRTVLRVHGVVAPLPQAMVVAIHVQAPAVLKDEPLARLLAWGLEPLSLVEQKPLVRLADLLADPTPAGLARAITTLTADTLTAGEVARERGFAQILPAGPYAGLPLHEALARTTDADTRAFLAYAVSYGVDYGVRRWRWAELYATWLLNGMPAPPDQTVRAEADALSQQALDAQIRGEFDKADDLWRAVLRLFPRDEDAERGRSQLHRRSNLRAQLDMDPEDQAVRWQLSLVLEELLATELLARELAVMAAAGYRLDEVQRWQANVARRLGRWDEAERLRRKVLERTGLTADQQALDTFLVHRRLNEAPDDPSVMLAACKTYLGARDYTSAQRQCQQARRFASSLKAEQQAWQAEEQARRVLRAREKTDTALDKLQNLELAEVDRLAEEVATDLAHLPHEANYQLSRLISDAQGRMAMETAARLAQRMIRLDEQSVDAWLHLAFARFFQRRADEALVALRRAEALDPQHGSVFWLRARLLLAQGRLAEARAAAQRLLQVDGRSAAALTVSARVALAEGRPGEAVLRLDRAWAKANVQSERGASLTDREAVESAAEASERLQRLARRPPADPEVRQARLKLALALLEVDLMPEAVVQLRQLPPDSPERREVAFAVAQALFTPPAEAEQWLVEAQDGTHDRAVALQRARAELAVRAAPGQPGPLVAWMRALVLDGQPAEARAVLAEATRRGEGKDWPQADRAALQAADRDARDAERADRGLDRARLASGRDDEQGSEQEAAAAYATYVRLGIWSHARDAAIKAASSALVLGRDEAALQWARKAVEHGKQDGFEGDLLSAREVLAHIEARLGKLDGWAPALEAMMQRCAARGRKTCVSGTERRLAELAAQEGRLHDALGHVQAAMRSAEKAGSGKAFRRALEDRVEYLRQAEDLPEAVTAATELLQAMQTAGDTAGERRVLLHLAALHGATGDVDLARRRFAEVEKAAQQASDRGLLSHVLTERGVWLLDGLGRPREARPVLEEALRLHLARHDRQAALTDRLALARGLLAVDLAEEASRQAALAEVQAVRQARTLLAMQAARTLALSAGTAEVALAAAERAVQRAERLQEPGGLALAHHAQAVAWLRQCKGQDGAAAGTGSKACAAALGALDKAVQAAVLQAFGQTGRSPGLGLRRERERLWADAVAVAVSAGDSGKALEWSALARAVAGRQARALTGVSGGDAEAEQALQRYVAALQRQQAARQAATQSGDRRAEQAAWQARADASARQADQVLARIRRDHRRVWTQIAVEPEALPALLPRLPEKTLLVQYFATADRLYVFLAGGRTAEPRIVEVPVSWRKVEAGVLAWRRAVLAGADRVALRGALALDDQAAPGLAQSATATDLPPDPPGSTQGLELRHAQALYDWLLAPIEAELKDARTVLVVPFGALHYLPLHGLVHAGPDGKPRYVLEDHRIGYLSGTTATALGTRARTAGHKPRVLGIGNPDGTLPGARQELEQARPHLGPGSQLWFGPDGTAKRFLAEARGFDVLHLATHGVLRPDPADSHLRMADGPLTLAAIAGAEGLAKRPRLVVLSACSTALQPGQAPGDEVASLATAFAVAGVPALVATLWDVDDQATAALVTAFYAGLARGMDTLEALRQAQLQVLTAGRAGRQDWASPAAWAALHLVGDPR